MSAAHGRTIINITDKKKQKEIADKIIKNDLSVRATERLAEKIKDELKPERKTRKSSKEKQKSDLIKSVENELMTLTGTKVNISGDEKKGKLELDYYSTEELNRLIDMIREACR
jgi:ParB family chromosome partitioning protein